MWARLCCVNFFSHFCTLYLSLSGNKLSLDHNIFILHVVEIDGYIIIWKSKLPQSFSLLWSISYLTAPAGTLNLSNHFCGISNFTVRWKMLWSLPKLQACHTKCEILVLEGMGSLHLNAFVRSGFPPYELIYGKRDLKGNTRLLPVNYPSTQI